jgi:glycosyltransferase involved in cell wall biosynthesis
MKIAILSRYQKTVNRGVESFVTELSAKLSKNHEVIILSGADSDSFSKMVEGKFDIVIPTNGWSQAFKASMGRLFGQYKLVITGQAGVGIADIFNIAVCRPNVFVALTTFAKQMTDDDKKLPFFQRIYAFFLKAKTWSLGSRVEVIPNGVDLKKFNPKGKKYDPNLKSPVVLSVGALEWYKHHEKTIKTLENLPNVSLLIVGAGGEKERLEGLGKQKLGDRFKIVQTPYEKMPEVYRSADVFTLPSWDREAFGIVYVEAMASGLPVVAPDDPPRREIIGEGGILTDVDNPEKFAKAIQEALDEKWGNKPKKQAENFSWEIIAKKYEELFKSLIN